MLAVLWLVAGTPHSPFPATSPLPGGRCQSPQLEYKKPGLREVKSLVRDTKTSQQQDWA